MRKVFVLLCLCLPAVLSAEDVNIAPGQCVWRTGDDPAWAAPTIDESGSLPYSAWQKSPSQPHIWIRCHTDLSPLRGSAQPTLQIRLYAAYQVFVNGSLIGSTGDLRSGHFSLNLIRNWPVPRDLPEPQSTRDQAIEKAGHSNMHQSMSPLRAHRPKTPVSQEALANQIRSNCEYSALTRQPGYVYSSAEGESTAPFCRAHCMKPSGAASTPAMLAVLMLRICFH